MFYEKPKRFWLSGILLILILVTLSQKYAANSQAPATILAAQAQSLPITAQAHIGNYVINLEVARTLTEQSKGLMFRTELPPDRGMLFPFSPPQTVSFWMKNCLIALDMIFMRHGKVIGIQAEAPPCKAEPCPLYSSPDKVDAVLEIGAGRAVALGIQVGDTIEIKKLAK